MGRYNAHLVGESNYQDAVSKLTVGTPIKLTLEPDNQFDPRAIKAVTVTGETVGYVERDSWLTRAMIDEGSPVASRVHEIIGGKSGKPSLGIVLEVLTADDARAALARSNLPSGVKVTSTNSDGTEFLARKVMPVWMILIVAPVGLLISFGMSNLPQPRVKDNTENPIVSITERITAVNGSGSAEPLSSNWSYSTKEDIVRGGMTYFSSTTSINSVRQDFPYERNTTMDMTVRKSPAQGTDVILTVSSGQLMCPSYEGCSGTVSFDEGSPQSVNFNGPSDNSSETVFIKGSQSFISKLKRSKRVVIEKTMYQAGNPQFEFNVAGLRWDH